MVHVKWPSPSFKVDLEYENDNIMKNGFYQRILQPSEHPKRVGAKKFYFFKTLLDGPLMIRLDQSREPNRYRKRGMFFAGAHGS